MIERLQPSRPYIECAIVLASRRQPWASTLGMARSFPASWVAATRLVILSRHMGIGADEVGDLTTRSHDLVMRHQTGGSADDEQCACGRPR